MLCRRTEHRIAKVGFGVAEPQSWFLPGRERAAGSSEVDFTGRMLLAKQYTWVLITVVLTLALCSGENPLILSLLPSLK